MQRALGQNVRAIRKARKLSQEAFAHLVGFNRTYIGSIEQGKRNLRLRTVERLADLVGAEPLQLLSRPGAPDAVPFDAPATAARDEGGRAGA